MVELFIVMFLFLVPITTWFMTLENKIKLVNEKVDVLISGMGEKSFEFVKNKMKEGK